MAISWSYPVRGVQAVLAIVVLGLMAYVCSWWSTHWLQAAPGPFSFLVFTPVWTLVALIALVVVQFKFSHLQTATVPKYGLLVLEGLTVVYWFAGFVSLAVFLADRICFGQVCDVARASTVISAFNFALWAGSFGMAVWAAVKGQKTAVAAPAKEVEMQQGA